MSNKWPNEVEKWRRKYAVTCIKSHYVGQGISHEVGDIREWTFTEAEAHAIVDRMNNDSWEPNGWAATEGDQYQGKPNK